MEIIPLLLLLLVCSALLLGYPVAFTLGGVSIIFALICVPFGIFDPTIFKSIPIRIFGIMNNVTLLAVPLFIFMGTILERSGIAAKMLENMSTAFKNIKGGLSISIIIVGALLAASTGIVGATVVTMGLMSLPTLISQGYEKSFSAGLVASTGTLGQIIPPSIVLILLAEMLQGANEEAGLLTGDLAPLPVTAIDLFAGALLPGLMLVGFFIIYILFTARLHPDKLPLKITNKPKAEIWKNALFEVIPPIFLILAVLGSIFLGVATPTESASVGAAGAAILALLRRDLNLKNISEAAITTVKMSSFVFIILIGASMFSLVFRGFQGDEMISNFLTNIPGGEYGALIIVMLTIFILGFFLDYIEIIFVIIPLVGPGLIANGADPLWLGILISLNLQTSFLTPPFGFSLFFLRGVAPENVKTSNIYAGVVPFIFIQIIAILLVFAFPQIATWLPRLIN